MSTASTIESLLDMTATVEGMTHYRRHAELVESMTDEQFAQAYTEAEAAELAAALAGAARAYHAIADAIGADYRAIAKRLPGANV